MSDESPGIRPETDGTLDTWDQRPMEGIPPGGCRTAVFDDDAGNEDHPLVLLVANGTQEYHP